MPIFIRFSFDLRCIAGECLHCNIPSLLFSDLHFRIYRSIWSDWDCCIFASFMSMFLSILFWFIWLFHFSRLIFHEYRLFWWLRHVWSNHSCLYKLSRNHPFQFNHKLCTCLCLTRLCSCFILDIINNSDVVCDVGLWTLINSILDIKLYGVKLYNSFKQ